LLLSAAPADHQQKRYNKNEFAKKDNHVNPQLVRPHPERQPAKLKRERKQHQGNAYYLQRSQPRRLSTGPHR
jgi:hypothetical protein